MHWLKFLIKVFFVSFLFASNAQAAERWMVLPPPASMPHEALKRGLAPVNGIKIYYAEYGPQNSHDQKTDRKRPAILLIHGGLGSSDVWAAQVKDLSKDHLVIVADSRGHGRSTRDARAFSYDLMMDDYIALLNYLHIGKVVLVGWSDGGIIGLDMAMKHPQRLIGVIAHAANISPDGVKADVLQNPLFAEYIERAGDKYRALSPTPGEYEDFVSQISLMWASQPNWTARGLARIRVPVLIAIGDHDEAVSFDHTQQMVHEIPGARLDMLKDTSHFSMLQAPDDYNHMIRKFLNEE